MRNRDAIEGIAGYSSETKDRSAETELLLGRLRHMVRSAEIPPEEFFSSGQYESFEKFDDLLIKLSNLAFHAVIEKDFTEALDIGRQALEISGISAANNISMQSPDDVVALTEGINWAAKTISYSFYSLKPTMLVAASQTEGVFFGYGDDGAYYLGTPTIGVASFHDPGDEVGYIITHCLKQTIPEWEYPWSGVSRQDDAFNILDDLSSGRKLVEHYADVTSPEEMKKARDTYMKNNFHDRLVKIGELLSHKENNPSVNKRTSL